MQVDGADTIKTLYERIHTMDVMRILASACLPVVNSFKLEFNASKSVTTQKWLITEGLILMLSCSLF